MVRLWRANLTDLTWSQAMAYVLSSFGSWTRNIVHSKCWGSWVCLFVCFIYFINIYIYFQNVLHSTKQMHTTLVSILLEMFSDILLIFFMNIIMSSGLYRREFTREFFVYRVNTRHPAWCAPGHALGVSGHQGKSKRRRPLCYAGRNSPSRQLDDFEIVMLKCSFIKLADLSLRRLCFCHFKRGQGLIQTLSACLLQ